MALYDDMILNIDTSDTRRLNAFKVPKKNIIRRSSFDKLSLNISEFKDNIYPKVVNGFKNPNSCTSFKVTSAYNISNFEVESAFNRRKQFFKKEYSPQSAVEYFGFIFVNNLVELRKIVKLGKIKKGNLHESVLGQANMGVSVSLYADIYHHGDNKNYPRSGFLLIVKYMRGRVCYVVEDNTPMEPQPNYDCHMSKVYNHESFPSIGRAFHTTQIYLYEYSDDFDLIEEPSHVIPWAAVEFVWSGVLLYKLIPVPIVVTLEPSSKDSGSKTVDKRILLTRATGNPTQRIKQSYTDCIPILCTQLQLKLANSKEENQENIVLDIAVTILSYHSIWVSFAPLMILSWQVSELIEWMSFEQEFLKPLIKNPIDDNLSLSDVFNKRITISRSIENKVTGLIDSQFINYLRLVVNDPSRDRAKMARLIEHFHETKTVGRIRLYDSSDSLLFLFPDSTLSQNFGIPAVKTLDVNYLHALLVTNKSLDFNQPTDLIDEFLEVELKANILKLCNSQNIGTKDEMLPMHILTQSLRNQNFIQKSKLREMCGSIPNSPLKFDPIDFEKTEKVVLDSVKIVGSTVASTVQNGKNSGKDEDRPYDPTENMMGLSGVNMVKKTNESRRPASGNDEPVNKVLKREDLSNKLLELLTKIESPSDPNDLTSSKIDSGQSDDDSYEYSRSSTSAVFPMSLDRNRFKTQFRHGVSMYVPKGQLAREDLNQARDQDLRFRDPVNSPSHYSDATLRYNGVNR